MPAQNKRPTSRGRTPSLNGDNTLAPAKFSVKETASGITSPERPSSSVGSASRRNTAMPLCMSRAQQAAAASAAQQARYRRTSTSVSGGLATVAGEDLPENVERAIHMMTTYPLMRVSGTAFENGLRSSRPHHTVVDASKAVGMGGSSRGSCTLSPIEQPIPTSPDSSRIEPNSGRLGDGWTDCSNNGSMMLESSQVMQRVINDTEGARDGTAAERMPLSMSSRVMRGDGMVRLAAAMKRGAMWQTIVTGVLVNNALAEAYRRRRLRDALERYMLPTLMERKAETGSVMDREALRQRDEARQAQLTEGGGGDGEGGGGVTRKSPDGDVLTNTYLKDHFELFAGLNNNVLLESLAVVMARYRYLSGEVIAHAGEPSQQALYFLVSGKCECRTRTDQNHPNRSPCGSAGSTRAHSAPFRRDTGFETTVLRAGETFGGIFNSNATFAGTYKALSQCIVWVLRADDFERIFKGFADRPMIVQYVEAMRQHTLDVFTSRYSPNSIYTRVPIYRTIKHPKDKYLEDFTPIVKVRGERLFEHGEAAGDVYCLVEGSVKRSVKGEDGTYATGVAHILSPNVFSTLKVPGRCILLGEEPHVLPCTQRYGCEISSRTAMLYRIPGERFVSALLDDANQFVALRERLTTLFTAEMKLDPKCLAFAPLLRHFPSTSLQTLAAAAEPRVLGRSVAVCEPAQSLRNVFLVTSGEVRDPRTYGHNPTAPLLTPPASDEDEDAEEAAAAAAAAGGPGANRQQHDRGGRAGAAAAGNGRGHAGARGRGAAAGGRGGAGANGAAGQHKGGRGGAAHAKAAVAGSEAAGGGAAAEQETPPEEKDWMTGSFFSDAGADGLQSFSGDATATMTLTANAGRHRGDGEKRRPKGPSHASTNSNGHSHGGHGKQAVASGTATVKTRRNPDVTPFAMPDEQQEFNPPLPTHLAKRFRFTLGGGWEGLLLAKWPNGWGTTTLVEAWAIPTAKIRAEFNSCPKATQSMILLAAREQQRDEMGLPSLSTAKLPPMSVYQPPSVEKVATLPPVASAGGSASRAKQSRGRLGGSQGARKSTGKDSGSSVRTPENELSLSSMEVTAQMQARGSLDSSLIPQPGAGGSVDGAQQAVAANVEEPAAVRPVSRKRVTIMPEAAHAAPDTTTGAAGVLRRPVGSTGPTSGARQFSAPAKTVTGGSSFASGARRLRGSRPPARVSTTAGADGSSDTGSTSPSRDLLGLLRGEYCDDELVLLGNIEREPVVLPPAGKLRGTRRQTSPQAAAALSAAWPSSNVGGEDVEPRRRPVATAGASRRGSRWFDEVPTYEPLPGTAATAAGGATVGTATASTGGLHALTWANGGAQGGMPRLAPNSQLLMRSIPKRGENLQAQADFFSATSSSRIAAAAEEAQPGPKRRSPAKGPKAVQLPKRHALTAGK